MYEEGIRVSIIPPSPHPVSFAKTFPIELSSLQIINATFKGKVPIMKGCLQVAKGTFKRGMQSLMLATYVKWWLYHGGCGGYLVMVYISVSLNHNLLLNFGLRDITLHSLEQQISKSKSNLIKKKFCRNEDVNYSKRQKQKKNPRKE